MLQLLRKQVLLELLLFLEKGVKVVVVSCQLRIKRLLKTPKIEKFLGIQFSNEELRSCAPCPTKVRVSNVFDVESF